MDAIVDRLQNDMFRSAVTRINANAVPSPARAHFYVILINRLRIDPTVFSSCSFFEACWKFFPNVAFIPRKPYFGMICIPNACEWMADLDGETPIGLSNVLIRRLLQLCVDGLGIASNGENLPCSPASRTKS